MSARASEQWAASVLFEGQEFEGEVVDVSDDTFVVQFERERAPILRLAEEVQLRLHGGSGMTVDARVVCRVLGGESADTPGYHFQVLRNIRPDFGAVFHGRKAFRVNLGETEKVTVKLTAKGLRRPVTGELKNISSSGIGVTLSKDGDDELYAHDRVALSFDLFPSGAPVELIGIIRRRQLRGTLMFYGIEFDTEWPGFEGQVERIGAFTRRHQLEDLRRRRTAEE